MIDKQTKPYKHTHTRAVEGAMERTRWDIGTEQTNTGKPGFREEKPANRDGSRKHIFRISHFNVFVPKWERTKVGGRELWGKARETIERQINPFFLVIDFLFFYSLSLFSPSCVFPPQLCYWLTLFPFSLFFFFSSSFCSLFYST